MVVAPALVDLTVLAALLVALGLVLVLHAFLGALFHVTGGILGRLPLAGNWIGGSLLVVEHRVNAALNKVIVGLEVHVAQSWHVLARIVSWTGSTIVRVAEATARVAWYVEVKYPVALIAATARRAEHAAGHVGHVTKVTVQKIYVTGKQVAHASDGQLGAAARAATRPLRADLIKFERWARAQIHALAVAVPLPVPGGLPGLRESLRGLERRYEALRKQVAEHKVGIGTGALAAAVTLALTKIGAGWMRCTKVRRVGRNVCRMDGNLLDAMLLDTLLIASSLSVVQFAKELQAVEHEVVGLMLRGVRETRNLEGL